MLIVIQAKTQIYGPAPDLLSNICKRILMFPIHEMICSVLSKLTKFLRLTLQNRWTTKFLDYPLQEAITRPFELADSSKSITRLLSQRSNLSFQVWNLWHKARLQIYPNKSFPRFYRQVMLSIFH